MNAYAHTFDSSKFDFGSNSFKPEQDTAKPIFYMDEVADPVTGDLVKVEMIKIQSPGEALCVYGGKVRPEDRARFARQYDAFKKGETLAEGTPLTQWSEVSANIDFVAQLRAYGFQTVEDVARMADNAMRLFHGALTLKRKAERFLSEQEKKKNMSAQDQAMEALKAELAALKAQITEPKAERKKPGPKPKIQLDVA